MEFVPSLQNLIHTRTSPLAVLGRTSKRRGVIYSSEGWCNCVLKHSFQGWVRGVDWRSSVPPLETWMDSYPGLGHLWKWFKWSKQLFVDPSISLPCVQLLYSGRRISKTGLKSFGWSVLQSWCNSCWYEPVSVSKCLKKQPTKPKQPSTYPHTHCVKIGPVTVSWSEKIIYVQILSKIQITADRENELV